MSEKLKKIFLESYDVIHKRDSLDKSLLQGAHISEVFIQRFIEGASSLFSDLKEYQPMTYESLLDCIDLWLLEYKVPRGGRLFTLVIIFNNHIITSQMINKHYIERRIKTGKIVPSSMECLNNEFYGYYSVFDGLNSPRNNDPAGMKNYKLPDSLGIWDEIDEFCKEYSVDKSIFSKVKKDSSYPLLIWISGDDGDIFLITDDESSTDVYRMNYKISDEFIKLKDPVKEVDEYCSKVIRGK